MIVTSIFYTVISQGSITPGLFDKVLGNQIHVHVNTHQLIIFKNIFFGQGIVVSENKQNKICENQNQCETFHKPQHNTKQKMLESICR